MIAKLLEILTGKDDVERIAYREDLAALNAHLRTRRLLIPRCPKRYLEAGNYTEAQLLEMIEGEAKELSDAPFEPWVLEMDGTRRLPAFSSRKRMEVFSGKISMKLNKVFALGAGEFLIADVTKGLNVDFVDLNALSEKSWEIGIIPKRDALTPPPDPASGG